MEGALVAGVVFCLPSHNIAEPSPQVMQTVRLLQQGAFPYEEKATSEKTSEHI